MNATQLNDDDSIDQPLFRTAEEAVRFCLRFNGKPERPASSMMADKEGLGMAGRGLAGLDGAHQAGIISNKMRMLAGRNWALNDLYYAVLVACEAEKYESCGRACCNKSHHTTAFANALTTLTEASKDLITGRYAGHLLREDLVRRLFDKTERKATLKSIAKKYGCSEELVLKHSSNIHRWLKGQKASQHFEASEGLESQAWALIETALRDAGIVG